MKLYVEKKIFFHLLQQQERYGHLCTMEKKKMLMNFMLVYLLQNLMSKLPEK